MFGSLGIEEVRLIATGLGLVALLAAMVMGLYWYVANKKDKRVAESGILPGPKQDSTEEEVDLSGENASAPTFSFQSAVGNVKVEDSLDEPKKRGFFGNKVKEPKSPKTKKERKPKKVKEPKSTRTKKDESNPIEVNQPHGIELPLKSVSTETTIPNDAQASPPVPRLQLKKQLPTAAGEPAKTVNRQGERVVPQLKQPTVFQDVNGDDATW